MRDLARGLLAATVVVAGSVALVSGTVGQHATEQPISPSRSSVDELDTAPSAAGGGRAPLGLEIRYVDAGGTVRVLEPADFPR